MILRKKDKQRLQAIAERTLPPEVEIWADGSRVDGSAHEGSDLDLVLRTPDASPGGRRVPARLHRRNAGIQHPNLGADL